MRFVIRAAVVAGIVALSHASSAQTDPHVGTWKLNLTKSKYNTGQPPRSSTVVVEAAGQGTKITATTILERRHHAYDSVHSRVRRTRRRRFGHARLRQGIAHAHRQYHQGNAEAGWQTGPDIHNGGIRRRQDSDDDYDRHGCSRQKSRQHAGVRQAVVLFPTFDE
jgi:hypothetical protein